MLCTSSSLENSLALLTINHKKNNSLAKETLASDNRSIYQNYTTKALKF